MLALASASVLVSQSVPVSLWESQLELAMRLVWALELELASRRLHHCSPSQRLELCRQIGAEYFHQVVLQFQRSNLKQAQA